MFWKKKIEKEIEKEIKERFDWLIMIDGEAHRVDEDTYDYISKLREEKARLQNEIDGFRPLLKNEPYDPPVSRDCVMCDFVVTNSWNGLPIGCRKNMTCESFKKKED